MNPIQTIMLRARRYWFTDGIWEMGFGMMSFINGLSLMAYSVWPNIFFLSFAPAFIWIIGPLLMRRFKERITYPRTGYAGSQPLVSSRTQAVGIILVVLFPLLFVLVAFLLPSDLAKFVISSLPFLAGMGIASGLFYWGRELKISRFYLLATFSVLLGGSLYIAALMNGVSAWEVTSISRDVGIYLTFMGLAEIGSGLITFRSYLRQHPAPMEEAR